jgi:hypothetical protein
VRHISFKKKHHRVRQYLGTPEPTPEAIVKAIRDYAYIFKTKAAEKIAKIACDH